MFPAELGNVLREELVCDQRLLVAQTSKNSLRLHCGHRFVPNWLGGGLLCMTELRRKVGEMLDHNPQTELWEAKADAVGESLAIRK